MLANRDNGGIGQAGRRLLLPSEVLRIEKEASRVFVRDLPHPILPGRLLFFEEAQCAGLWDRCRDGAVATLTIEQKVLAIEQKQLRFTHQREV